MRFCCRAFEYWHSMAGKRGFGVFAAEIGNPPAAFVIQHRALDSGENPPAFSPVPLSLISDLVIQFCPWCGTRLDEFYRGTVEQIDKTGFKLI